MLALDLAVHFPAMQFPFVAGQSRVLGRLSHLDQGVGVPFHIAVFLVGGILVFCLQIRVLWLPLDEAGGVPEARTSPYQGDKGPIGQ